MVAAIEHRVGRVNHLPQPIEWLSDNGSPYVARETRGFAREIGLIPKTTPIESPQSNGMAEAGDLLRAGGAAAQGTERQRPWPRGAGSGAGADRAGKGASRL